MRTALQRETTMRTPGFIVFMGLVGAFSTVSFAGTPTLVVLAATPLAAPLQEVSDAYTAATGQVVSVSLAASSALVRQLESGTQADVFLPADIDSMESVEKHDLID